MRWSRGVVALLLPLTLSGPAAAGDRPYLATSSAAAEEDDDAVWSVESWLQRVGPVRTISVAPEYAFDPTTSVQFQFTRARERSTGLTDQQVELEFKHLLNHIARDGYGWGIVAALSWAKAQGGSSQRSVGVTLPYTLALWEAEGALHANVGLAKAGGARRTWNASLALERQVARRTTLFAEFARAGEARLLHGGLRWWAKKEKLAFDLSLLHSRSNASSERGWVLGFGWYDL